MTRILFSNFASCELLRSALKYDTQNKSHNSVQKSWLLVHARQPKHAPENSTQDWGCRVNNQKLTAKNPQHVGPT